MLKKVVIPLNLRETIDRVVEMCGLTQSLGAEKAVLVHIGSNRGRAGKQNQKRLDTYAAELTSIGLEVETAVRSGSVQTEIENTAAETGTDFIGLPFKKKNFLTRAILGSTVKDIIRMSDLPVFVYKKPGFRQRNDEVFRVLYATSLQGRDEIIISYVRNENFKIDEMVFLHVGRRAPDPFVEKERLDSVEKALQEIGEQCGLQGKEKTYEEVLGSPRREIVKAARRFTADLVLLGKADTTGGGEPVLGSTAEEVSYNASCSVLIIPKKIDVITGGGRSKTKEQSV